MRRAHAISHAVAFLLTIITCSNTLANPVLNHTSAGQVTISQQPNSTLIQQSSQKAILNWNSFNIGAKESVHFQQPRGGIALNRINPSQGASQIYGRLTATGNIILINPAGIYFGSSAFVNVGGLIATTADMRDRDFLNGHYQFSRPSSYAGAIINEGKIILHDNGLAALVASGVVNHGLIQARMGHVILASGEAFTMDFSGDQLINFAITQATTKRGVDKNGHSLRDGVTNTGLIIADGGTILVSAKAAQGVLDNSINMSGLVQAKSVAQAGGEIILSGEINSGIVKVGGKLIASGKGNGQRGGNIIITGNQILLTNTANIDASGDAGGGNINIGGSYQGSGPLPNASAIAIAPGAIISADAMISGNGGNIIAWANDVNKVYGSLSAVGGALGGNGGFIETSAKNYLDVAGIKVNTLATSGKIGTWLLDPLNITISTNATSNGSFDGSSPNVFTPSAIGSNVNVTDLQTALNASNVTITTSSPGIEDGDITINNALSWTAATTLLLQADNNIIFNAGISNSAGTLTLSAANNITTNVSNAINVANLNLANGTFTLNAANSINNTVSFNLSTGTTFDLNGIAQQVSQLNSASGAGTITNTSATTANFTVNNSATSSYGGNISGAINFIKNGNATLTLSGAGSYTGSTLIQGGNLAVNSTALGNSNLVFSNVAGATLTLNDNVTVDTIEGGGVLGGNINLNGFNFTTTSASGNAKVYAGTISGIGNFLKGGNYPLTLSGTNTFVGKILVTGNASSNFLSIASDAALGAIPASPTADSITLGANGSIRLIGFTLNSNRGIYLAPGLTGTLNIQGVVTYNGVISGSGIFYKVGSGQLVLGGANTYTNNLHIQQGSILLAAENTLPVTSSISEFRAGTTLFLNNINQTLASISPGLGAISLGSGTLTLSAGSISGIISGTGNIVKNSASTLTLSGTNTYDGTTVINAGTLSIANNAALGSALGNTLVNSGATLLLANGLTVSENINLSGGMLANNGITSLLGNTILTQNSIISSSGTLTLGNVDGAYNLAAQGAGDIAFGDIGSSIALNNITSQNNNLTFSGMVNAASFISNTTGTTHINGGAVTTTGTQMYGNTILLGSSAALTGNSISFTNSILGGQHLTIHANNISINASLALSGLSIAGSGANNSLLLNTGNAQQFNITGTNAGTIIANGAASTNFSNIQNITGGTRNNTYIFTHSSSKLTGTLNGGSLSNVNTLNFSQGFNSPITITLTGNIFSGNAGSAITNFTNINQLIGYVNATNTIHLPAGKSMAKDVVMTGNRSGYIGDPLYFFNFDFPSTPSPAPTPSSPNVAPIIEPWINNPITNIQPNTLATPVSSNLDFVIQNLNYEYHEYIRSISIKLNCGG